VRGSSGQTHLCILEGKVSGKKVRARPIIYWIDDITGWTGLETYEKVKRWQWTGIDGNP